MRSVPWIFCMGSARRMQQWFRFFNRLPESLRPTKGDDAAEDWIIEMFFLWVEGDNFRLDCDAEFELEQLTKRKAKTNT